jgi:hypothetical protein
MLPAVLHFLGKIEYGGPCCAKFAITSPGDGFGVLILAGTELQCAVGQQDAIHARYSVVNGRGIDLWKFGVVDYCYSVGNHVSLQSRLAWVRADRVCNHSVSPLSFY